LKFVILSAAKDLLYPRWSSLKVCHPERSEGPALPEDGHHLKIVILSAAKDLLYLKIVVT
jgi:hypothetical protein